MELLIDTNVVLDVFLKREPFFAMSDRAITLSRRYSDINSFISASTVTDIYYIAYKNLKNHQVVRNHFKKFFEFVGVVNVTADDIHDTFALNWKDFEDSVQYSVAKSNHFDAIVTRNMEGFDADDAVKIFTPEKFCKHIDNTLRE